MYTQVEIHNKEEDNLRSRNYKKRSNHSRSSIGSVNIVLNNDEDMDNTSNKGVEVIEFVFTFKILTMLLILVKETPCQLAIGSIDNIVAVATIFDGNIESPNV